MGEETLIAAIIAALALILAGIALIIAVKTSDETQKLAWELHRTPADITDALKTADEGELYEDADGLFRLGIKRKK